MTHREVTEPGRYSRTWTTDRGETRKVLGTVTRVKRSLIFQEDGAAFSMRIDAYGGEFERIDQEGH